MMEVTLIDNMGSDLTVVNAARVSFDKRSELETHNFETIDEAENFAGEKGGDIDWNYIGSDRWFGGYPVHRLSDRDTKLISYLAKHKHWTPFAHCFASFRIKAPLFVARQLGKHQVGLVWNEVSRRYVDAPPEFFTPATWRKKAENVKQGSNPDETVIITSYADLMEDLVEYYDHLIGIGVCPEQARMVLPQSMMTEWIWSGSIAAFARVCNLRMDPHTQVETQYIAHEIDTNLTRLYPVSWKHLMS